MSDDLNEALKQAAVAAVRGVNVVADSVKHLNRLIAAVEAGQITWRDHPAPKGARGLEGKSKEFNVLVVQANLPHGIDHSGMFTVSHPTDVVVIVMPKALAHWVYHKVVASRN